MNGLNETLVVIPARGGSKRIPKKNIVDVAGQPMIYWPITELLKVFDKQQVIVSTDDEEIALIAENLGIRAPFRRPPELSDDFVATMPVIQHALDWYEKHNSVVEYVLVIYPTALGVASSDILQAYSSLVDDSDCDMVMSVLQYPFPIQRAVFEPPNNAYIRMFQPEFFAARSQDLVEAFHDAGQFYFFRADAIKGGRELPNANIRKHQLKRKDIVDIDTPGDLEFARLMMKERTKDSTARSEYDMPLRALGAQHG